MSEAFEPVPSPSITQGVLRLSDGREVGIEPVADVDPETLNAARRIRQLIDLAGIDEIPTRPTDSRYPFSDRPA